MGELAKWGAGLTLVALAATVFRSKYASADITAAGGALRNVYRGAQGL